MATLTTSQIPNYNYLTPAQQATVQSAIAAGQTAAVINNFVQQSVSANYTPTSTLDPTVAQQYGITGTQVQTINPSMPNFVSPQTLQAAQQQTQKIQQTNAAQAAAAQAAAKFDTSTLGAVGQQINPVTASNGVTYYPTQNGWEQTQYASAAGYVPQSQLNTDLTAQRSYAQTYVAPSSYVQTSTLDPTVAKQYGITGTQVQTVNPNAANWISPETLEAAQQQTQQIQQTNQAQAAFTLPDAGSTSQTITSPNGTQYISVPADPVTGSAAQWYQMGPNQTYTPVGQDLKPATTANGPVAPVTQTQLNQQQATAAQDVIQYQQQQYAASIPHTTVTNIDPTTGQSYTTQYQSVDPTLPEYAKATDIQLAQQQATANQTAYQAAQAQAQQQAQAVAAYQAAQTASANQQQATEQAQLAANQAYVTQLQQQEQTAQAQAQQFATQQAQQVAASQQQAAQTKLQQEAQAINTYGPAYAQAMGFGSVSNAVTSFDPTTPITPTNAVPTYDVSTNTNWTPTANGWKQSSNANLPGYTAANNITPLTVNPSQPFTSPSGVTYYPNQSFDNSTDSIVNNGWVQGSNPNSADYVANASTLYTQNQQTLQQAQTAFQQANPYYANGINYFPSPNPNINQGIPINGHANMVQTSDPSAPGYITQSDIQDAAQTAQQAAISSQIASQNSIQSLDIGSAFASLDKAVGSIIPGGWGTLATIAGSVIAGPLGAAVANATAGAVKGETPGQILQGAALSYATSYGIDALNNALTPAVTEAQTGIANGTIAPSTDPVSPVDVTTAPDGSTTISTSSGVNATVDPAGTVTTTDPLTNSTTVTNPTEGTVTTTVVQHLHNQFLPQVQWHLQIYLHHMI